MNNEWHLEMRPTDLKDVVGQDQAVKELRAAIKKGLPHSIMLSGPSGVGKTTLARIIQRTIDCCDNEFKEMDCGLEGGKDVIRHIREHLWAMPSDGGNRIWYVDEAHGLTPQAQNALLKTLEDGRPDFVYFILSTTEPNKLKRTIRTRCLELNLKLVKPDELEKLSKRVAKAKKFQLPEEVCERLVEAAEGSPRKALVMLQTVASLDSEEDMLSAISSSQEADCRNLAQLLLDTRSTWSAIAKTIKKINEEPETIRRQVLGYVNAILLSGKQSDRAYHILDLFCDPWYGIGKSNEMSYLVRACYELSTKTGKK